MKIYRSKKGEITKGGKLMSTKDILKDLNRKYFLENKNSEMISFYENMDSFSRKQIKEKIKEILFD